MILNLGERGTLLAGDDTTEYVPVEPVKAVDTTGVSFGLRDRQGCGCGFRQDQHRIRGRRCNARGRVPNEETVGPKIGVKASGGIKDFTSASAMISAGADRIGTSSGVEIIRGAGKST